MRKAFAIDAIELSAARQAAPLARARIPAAHAYGVRRLRPLRRRRFRIERPPRVLILARKPWVRARLRFLG